MKIIAVVVTYNRLALLQRTIAALKAQTRPLDAIVVVNNGATDGTADWLETQQGLEVFTQDNVGGSGGFARGIREAGQMGADRIWCMDDDVFPRPSCLERLLEAAATHPDAAILAPRRFMGDKIICHDFTRYNLTNPLASMYGGKLRKCPPTAPTYVAGTAFEGPLISRQVVDTVGLPNAELFIFCDDTDYCLRTHLAGLHLLYVPQAEMDKAEFFTEDTWAERETKRSGSAIIKCATPPTSPTTTAATGPSATCGASSALPVISSRPRSRLPSPKAGNGATYRASGGPIATASMSGSARCRPPFSLNKTLTLCD